jgi:hypothetical protein
VTLDFLDNVFGLHLALKAPQGILKGFAFLYSNLCQEKYTSKQSQSGYSKNTPKFGIPIANLCLIHVPSEVEILRRSRQ